MTMRTMETDYLVVGAGAMGMAFTDALIDHADVHVTLVDRRHAAGGHWQDAYPFVQLHQASLFYGVASTVLGSGALQQEGPESGLQERARRRRDPALLRLDPPAPIHRLRPRRLSRRQRLPHRRRRASRDIAGNRRDHPRRCAPPLGRRHLPVTDDPGDHTATVRHRGRGSSRRHQRTRHVVGGTELLRDRRFREDRHRRHRVVADQRRAP